MSCFRSEMKSQNWLLLKPHIKVCEDVQVTFISSLLCMKFSPGNSQKSLYLFIMSKSDPSVQEPRDVDS